MKRLFPFLRFREELLPSDSRPKTSGDVFSKKGFLEKND
jgi:hypothetical protein